MCTRDACTRDRSCDAYCKAVHSIASSYSRLTCFLQSVTLVQSVRTSMIVEVRAAGFPTVWESACGNCNVLLTLLLLLLLQRCATPVSGAVTATAPSFSSCRRPLLVALVVPLLCAEQSLLLSLQHLPRALAVALAVALDSLLTGSFESPVALVDASFVDYLDSLLLRLSMPHVESCCRGCCLDSTTHLVGAVDSLLSPVAPVGSLLG
jgi:hypothetical protein